MDPDYELNKIQSWILGKGYHLFVDSKVHDEICHKSKVISLNSKHNKLDKVYILLHECGHLIALSNKKSRIYKQKESLKDGDSYFKVFRVEEEIDAWTKGLALARKINIPINEDKWNEMFYAAIQKYIKWAAK